MKRLYTIFLLLLATFLPIVACTTAIISGKYTVDGRPLLYKHRDTDALQNKVMYFDDGKYKYIGIVNSNDKYGKEVWGGYNSTGFAIMNSASYNLNPEQAGKDELEGVVMKLALQQCATLADFERLLDSLPKPMYLSANFGVIDALGGAAYYETGDYSYKKFDANDPLTAPRGYLIRTNYSFSGDRNRDKGISRYMAAEPILYQAALSNSLSYKFLLQDVSRNLKHGLTGTNLYNNIPLNNDKPIYVPFRDFIPRYSTSSVIVVQGTKGDEPPALTTMWTILGSPLTSVAIPVWLNKNNIYPSILIAERSENADLCNWSLFLKKELFPISVGEGNDYINLAALLTSNQTGILQKIKPIENLILENGNSLLEKWRKNEQLTSELKDFYNQIDNYVSEFYLNELKDDK
ncbi:hypothetical protein JGH11_08980 [Dysgonomonas sp. Marseille-P4677]|uniref:hypothetical protein n=1 Tax=Dysgonomonas sp. Marseille-P4677 TaxID=2364790 RepID=UPI001914535C|nr:hypothetical protein [Dysgonomonas sp. Marseille-P4677]MBK5721001.1 hypothetical protein [Dysgonomonas sp. Marseille-P4677]